MDPRKRDVAIGCIASAILLGLTAVAGAAEGGRVEHGLLALYDFEELSGQVIHDRASAGEPLDLVIERPGAARFRKGALVVQSAAAIASAGPAARVIDSVRQANSISIEAWVTPDDDRQAGPARIVSLSADPMQRNFTLGQDAARYDVRLRTTTTGVNGIPSTPSSDAATSARLTHVVYTRDAAGQARIYLDGREDATNDVPGTLQDWSDDFHLLLANERTGDRPWLGSLHLVALYGRALTAEEVAANFAAGSGDGQAIEGLLPPVADRRIDFVQDVLPILKEHCHECHAGDREEGGFSLGRRERALEGGASGPVVAAGDSAASPLIHLVAGIEADRVMPPRGGLLADDQIGVLRAWIDQGLSWPAEAEVPDPRIEAARSHWAFQPLRQVELPSVAFEAWVRTPVDRFILAALEAIGLSPAAPIDPGRMCRRLTFDLIGLPPDPLEVAGFVEAVGRDRAAAEAESADRLLASPHYGERWGRHWLDVARYADSDGMEGDADRPHAYRYRDFVIRALNEDLPFDTFVQWQIAGDEIEPDHVEAAAATGFLTAGPSTFLEDKFLEEERLRNRYNELDDVLSTLGTAFLGLTLGCARCHDHKYDAVTSREYYRLLSAFHGGDRQNVQLRADATEVLAFRDSGGQPRTTWLFGRGDFYDRARPVELGFLDVLSRGGTAADYWAEARRDAARSDTTYQRKALARWMTDVDRGAGALAARVVVNRVWQHHFGEGLVHTVGDFGVRGEPPTHPDLLEWLAHDFVSQGWRLKRLHRLIVTSAVYQQGPRRDDAAARADPDNRLLACIEPRRLEAEALRDAMLHVSGTLNPLPFGPGFKPPIPAEAMVARNTQSPYPTDAVDDASTRRRSVYMFHKRVVPYPLLAAFDRPDAQQACGRRDRTTVAPQGLALLNDAFVRARAVDFAERLLAEGVPEEALVERAFALALARPPTETERTASVDFLQSQQSRRLARALEGADAEARRDALADFCQALFGLNEFLYID